jgi:hypothetical protein
VIQEGRIDQAPIGRCRTGPPRIDRCLIGQNHYRRARIDRVRIVLPVRIGPSQCPRAKTVQAQTAFRVLIVRRVRIECPEPNGLARTGFPERARTVPIVHCLVSRAHGLVIRVI